MRSGSCPRRFTRPAELSFSVRRAIFTSLPVLVALFLLPAIAFASPPDQLWIAGFYDGADGDDILSLVYETAGVEPAATRPGPVLPRTREISLVSGPSTIHGLAACESTRAPPPLALILSCSIRSGLLATFPASTKPRSSNEDVRALTSRASSGASAAQHAFASASGRPAADPSVRQTRRCVESKLSTRVDVREVENGGGGDGHTEAWA
jgi:hypothetical protein